MTQVKSLDQLKEMIANGIHDFFIALNGGFRSSKFLDYSPKTGKYYILNEIDGTEQRLNEKHLMDMEYTNVGYALTVGALYSYEQNIMDKYTKKYIKCIKNAKNDNELSDIIDKIYTDGFDDGEQSK